MIDKPTYTPYPIDVDKLHVGQGSAKNGEQIYLVFIGSKSTNFGYSIIRRKNSIVWNDETFSEIMPYDDAWNLHLGRVQIARKDFHRVIKCEKKSASELLSLKKILTGLWDRLTPEIKTNILSKDLCEFLKNTEPQVLVEKDEDYISVRVGENRLWGLFG